MIDREAMSPAVHVVVALTCALATGCACVKHAQTEPVPTAPPAASIPVAVTPIETAPAVEPTPAVVEAPRAPAKPAPAVRASVPKAPVKLVAHRWRIRRAKIFLTPENGTHIFPPASQWNPNAEVFQNPDGCQCERNR